jgi:hypothetical protein
MQQRIVAVGLAVLLLSVGACGQPATPPTQGTGTTMPEPTTMPLVTSTTVFTPPTTLPTPTTSEAIPFREDGTLRALPETVPPALATDHVASEVPWNALDDEWLLLVVAAADYRSAALVMLAPDDATYLLGGWEASDWVHDWAPDGQRVVFASSNQVLVLDLLSGCRVTIDVDAAPGDYIEARFTRPSATSVIVSRWAASEPSNSLRVFGSDGTPSSQPATCGVTTCLYDDADGTIVLADADGVRVITPEGGTVRRLATPGLDCRVRRWWAHQSVLVSCIDPVYAGSEIFDCWPDSGRGLWAVPLEGGPAVPIGPTVGPGGSCGAIGVYEDPRIDALALEDALFVVTDGCCECGGILEVHRPGSRVDLRDVCWPRLLTRRGDAAVVFAHLWSVGEVVLTVTGEGTVGIVAGGATGSHILVNALSLVGPNGMRPPATESAS